MPSRLRWVVTVETETPTKFATCSSDTVPSNFKCLAFHLRRDFSRASPNGGTFNSLRFLKTVVDPIFSRSAKRLSDMVPKSFILAAVQLNAWVVATGTALPAFERVFLVTRRFGFFEDPAAVCFTEIDFTLVAMFLAGLEIAFCFMPDLGWDDFFATWVLRWAAGFAGGNSSSSRWTLRTCGFFAGFGR